MDATTPSNPFRSSPQHAADEAAVALFLLEDVEAACLEIRAILRLLADSVEAAGDADGDRLAQALHRLDIGGSAVEERSISSARGAGILTWGRAGQPWGITKQAAQQRWTTWSRRTLVQRRRHQADLDANQTKQSSNT